MNFNYSPYNPQSKILISPTGGYYSDSLAFGSDGFKRFPTGSFVNLNDAPGKSRFDCKACPTGKIVEYVWLNCNEYACVRPRT